MAEKDSTPARLAKFVKSRRRELKLSQKATAEKAGTSFGNLRRIEAGDIVRDEALANLHVALQVDRQVIDDLLADDSKSPRIQHHEERPAPMLDPLARPATELLDVLVTTLDDALLARLAQSVTDEVAHRLVIPMR